MAKSRFSGNVINKMQLKLPALSANEGMARAAVAAFCAQLDPMAVELADVKCAVSEAVTNCIVHAYKNTEGWIYITVSLLDVGVAKIEIKDRGCGIDDVKEARKPLFTTDAAGERSGMGFTVMESFTDAIRISSKVGRGTKITLYKAFTGRRDT